MMWLPLSTAVLAASAIVGVILAAAALQRNARVERENRARQIHLDYLQVAMAHPHLSGPAHIKLKTDDGALFKVAVDVDFEKYEWFVSYLLSAAGVIWDAVGSEHIVGRLMKLQVSYHADYIALYGADRVYLKYWLERHGREIDAGLKIAQERKDHERRNYDMRTVAA